MIHSGVTPIDERLGGLLPGRLHVLTGAPGTGKSVACLEFLQAGLDAGERGVLLTVDDPTDVISQAEFLGLDFERALRDERLVLLRYQLDFSRRFGRAPSPDLAFDELRRLVGEPAPARLVVDTAAPFLEAGTASGAGIAALARLLEESGATSIVTYPGDLAGLYDRRLEPLVQRAAAILHFALERDRSRHIEVRKVRFQVPSAAPIGIRIEPGVGLVAAGDVRARRVDDLPEETKRRLLVLDLADGFPEEHLAVLRRHFDVAVRAGVTSVLSAVGSGSTGAIVIDVRRDSLDDALTIARELRRGGCRAPIALATAYRLRSTDCARALRAGADDFISTAAQPDEVLLRIESLARRPHSAAREAADVEVPVVSQPTLGDRLEPLDPDAFRGAVEAHLRGDRVPFFTIVKIHASNGDRRALSDLALRSMRVEGGDLAGTLDDGVAVYLHSARRKDVRPFVDRLRDGWRRDGGGEIEVDTWSYPADEQAVHSLLRADAPADA